MTKKKVKKVWKRISKKNAQLDKHKQWAPVFNIANKNYTYLHGSSTRGSVNKCKLAETSTLPHGGHQCGRSITLAHKNVRFTVVHHIEVVSFITYVVVGCEYDAQKDCILAKPFLPAPSQPHLPPSSPFPSQSHMSTPVESDHRHTLFDDCVPILEVHLKHGIEQLSLLFVVQIHEHNVLGDSFLESVLWMKGTNGL